MFQMGKNSINTFKISKKKKKKNWLFKIYFKVYKHELYLLLIYVHKEMIRALDQSF